MKRRIIFATGNKDKMKEIRQILADLGMEIISMKEAGVDIDIVEDGMSFEENAAISTSPINPRHGLRTSPILTYSLASGFSLSVSKIKGLSKFLSRPMKLKRLLS